MRVAELTPAAWRTETKPPKSGDVISHVISNADTEGSSSSSLSRAKILSALDHLPQTPMFSCNSADHGTRF
jgi:hypothetical protein